MRRIVILQEIDNSFYILIEVILWTVYLSLNINFFYFINHVSFKFLIVFLSLDDIIWDNTNYKIF